VHRSPKSLYANWSRTHLTHSHVWLDWVFAARAGPESMLIEHKICINEGPKRPPRGVEGMGGSIKSDKNIWVRQRAVPGFLVTHMAKEQTDKQTDKT
jgi:hypothetical protein